MAGWIGIRREDARRWERRTPITPDQARKLIEQHGIEVEVETSAQRAFTSDAYKDAGAVMTDELTTAPVVFGVKEVPLAAIQAGKTFVFFPHVIKGQPYNMPMLAELMKAGCTVIDYEKVTDVSGRRLIFFGQFAGVAGMIDSLWALGKRLQWEGWSTPFGLVKRASDYDSLVAAKHHINQVGQQIRKDGLPQELCPLIVGTAGYGNVASGVEEILVELPTRQIKPADLIDATAEEFLERNVIYQVTFREEHMVEHKNPLAGFDLQEYYNNPSSYRPVFRQYQDQLTVLMNCIYWEDRYPRLVTKAAIRDLFDAEHPPRLRIIGDISCDENGAIECNVKTTEPNDPVYVYDWRTDAAKLGVAGDGPVILAVDILPTELPKEASESFANVLARFIPAIAQADYGVPFDELDLPEEIKRAVILYRGALRHDYKYLEHHLPSSSS